VTSRLKHHHPEPLYRQLIAAILQQIATGQIKPGEELPSTRQLGEIYGVSTITVRRALTTLQEKGYIHGVPGKGTFVTYSKIDKPLNTWASFSADMRRHGLTPSSLVLRAELGAADPKVAEALDVTEGAEVVILERVRLGDGVPLCIQICYLVHSLCPGILQHDFTHQSLYQVLQDEYALVWGKSWHRIWATLATERELRWLGLSAPAVILWIEGHNYLASGQVFEYAETAYRADRYQVRSHGTEVSIGFQGGGM